MIYMAPFSAFTEGGPHEDEHAMLMGDGHLQFDDARFFPIHGSIHTYVGKYQRMPYPY